MTSAHDGVQRGNGPVAPLAHHLRRVEGVLASPDVGDTSPDAVTAASASEEAMRRLAATAFELVVSRSLEPRNLRRNRIEYDDCLGRHVTGHLTDDGTAASLTVRLGCEGDRKYFMGLWFAPDSDVQPIDAIVWVAIDRGRKWMSQMYSLPMSLPFDELTACIDSVQTESDEAPTADSELPPREWTDATRAFVARVAGLYQAEFGDRRPTTAEVQAAESRWFAMPDSEADRPEVGREREALDYFVMHVDGMIADDVLPLDVIETVKTIHRGFVEAAAARAIG